MTIEIIQDDRNGLIACDERLLWVEWRNSRRVEQIDTIERTLKCRQAAASMQSNELLYVHQVSERYQSDYDGRLPSPELAQAIMAHLKRIQSSFSASAVILQTQGLTSRLLRGFAATVIRMVPSPVPSRVFSQIPSALEWMGREIERRPGSISRPKPALRDWAGWCERPISTEFRRS